eukprot:CAMPEP_0202975606 /NCGR_PEP_ID=MMETSP1396-20130829/70367_1 /ASSEMBLY_ACC=CAM_ASM_000872 /TAXON_ID= /ORGANISM="Pseudokeronopsis sp., Strain Brazil" /LENGTH=81 /DNA_ID=CAMNT_0049711435 /DNA_START=384 /DNA_END=626 /DNA_ORIENTATION=-
MRQEKYLIDGIEHALGVLKGKDKNTMLIFASIGLLDSPVHEDDLVDIFSPNYSQHPGDLPTTIQWLNHYSLIDKEARLKTY